MIGKLVAFAVLVSHAECIISKKALESESNEDKKADDGVAEQSIKRGFSYGEEGGLGSYGQHEGGYYGEGYDHHTYGGGHDLGKFHTYEDHYKYDHHKEHHEHHGHHDSHHDPAYYKALAIKGLLLPLAGVALLGAAAAFVTNPILLQLGVISSTYGRKKRDLRGDAAGKLHEMKLLERFMSQMSQEEMQDQEEKLLANYLQCSGPEHSCLERLSCELHSRNGMPVETNIMAIITNEILTNKFVPEGLKTKITRAVQTGRGNGDCRVYECQILGKFVTE